MDPSSSEILTSHTAICTRHFVIGQVLRCEFAIISTVTVIGAVCGVNFGAGYHIYVTIRHYSKRQIPYIPWAIQLPMADSEY
jgi:hypothetical protein